MAAEPGIHVSLSDSETLKDAKSLIGVLRLPVIGKIKYWKPSYRCTRPAVTGQNTVGEEYCEQYSVSGDLLFSGCRTTI